MDPRRPAEVPSKTEKAEGLMQYHPELPATPMTTLTYNQTVAGLAGLHATPAALESVCLVLGVGLDLWFARTSPSSNFDVLPEDFNYTMLLLLIAALFVFIIFIKNMQKRKRLASLWK